LAFLSQAAGTRATKLELAGSYDQAFQTYVQAAQAYLFLIRHTQDGETKAKLRGVSNKLVERAEKIKQVKKGTIGVPKKDRFAIGELQSNHSVQRFTHSDCSAGTEEQDSVLNRSSLLDGQRLPRWTEGSERTIDAVQ
jgi:calpain-7